MDGTMKQLVFKTKGEIEVLEVPIPSYGDDGVLVKVAYAGICGSDISAFTKGSPNGGVLENSKFGHEFVGTIVEVGSNVEDLHVGDRVWVHPDYANESASYSCMAGGFAEYCGSLKAIKDETIFVLPDDLPMRTAVLIEPFGVGVYVKNRAGVKPGDNVLMWGAGPIGIMGWFSMKHAGIENVFIAEQSPQRIGFARNLGIDVFDNKTTPATEYGKEKFGAVTVYPSSPDRADVDRYLDYVGIGVLMNEYLEQGRPQSVFATLSLDRTPLTIDPGAFMSGELEVRGSRSYTTEDIKEVIDVMMDKNIDVSALITHEFSLDEAQDAFDVACARGEGMKVIFNIAGDSGENA